MILIVIRRRIMTVLIIKLTLRIAHFLLLKTLKKLRNGLFEACGVYEKANSRSIPMSNLLPMSNLFPSINGWGVFLLLFSLFTGWSVYIAELLLLLSRHMCLLEVHCAYCPNPCAQPHPRSILCHGPTSRGLQRGIHQLVGRLQSEDPAEPPRHLVRYTYACSDSAWAGSYLRCPILITVVSKLWSQDEWALLPVSRSPLYPFINTHIY